MTNSGRDPTWFQRLFKPLQFRSDDWWLWCVYMIFVAFCLDFPRWTDESFLARVIGGIVGTGVDAVIYVAGFSLAATWFGPAPGMAAGFALEYTVKYILTQLNGGQGISFAWIGATIVVTGVIGLMAAFAGGFAVYLFQRNRTKVK